MFLKVKKTLRQNLLLVPVLLLFGVVFFAQALGNPAQDSIEVKPQKSPPLAVKSESTTAKEEVGQVNEVVSTKPPVRSAVTTQAPKETMAAPQQVSQVSLLINTGSESYSYKTNWAIGLKVFDALTRGAQENGFTFEYDNYGSWGAFVTEIHGVKGDWVFEITREGKLIKPDKGASTYEVLQDDIINWKKI